MPRISKADTALRQIITGKAALKVKRRALETMAAPSQTFLSALLADDTVHPKLKLDASERLAKIRGKEASSITGINVGVKPGVEPRPARGTNTYIMDESTRELLYGDSKPIPESAATEQEVPQPAAPVADGVSCARPQCGQQDSAEAERTRDLAGRLAEFRKGKEIAGRVVIAYERFCRAPHNLEEAWRLEGLQKEFAEWERATREKFPDWNVAEDFRDPRLRPHKTPMNTDRLARMRRSISPIEAHFQSLALAEEANRRGKRKSDSDDGMWSGIPK